MVLPVELGEELERRAKEIQASALEAAVQEGPGVRLSTCVCEGVPALELIEASRGADMLVIGSRGAGGFRGLLLGSICLQCAHHAHCAVVIVREGCETPEAA